LEITGMRPIEAFTPAIDAADALWGHLFKQLDELFLK